MKKTFCKSMSVILAMLQIILLFAGISVSAASADDLAAAGEGNPGWKTLSELDFASDSTIGSWIADTSGNIGTVSDGALPLWDSSKPATNKDFMTLTLKSAVSNTVLWSVTYNVKSTARPIEMSVISGGTRIGIATLENAKIKWDLGSGRTKDFSVTPTDNDRKLTVIVNTRDNSAALLLDGAKLGEAPFRTFPTHYENLAMFRIGAAGEGSVSPVLKAMSIYDTGSEAPLQTSEGAVMETFGADGPKDTLSQVTWTDRHHTQYGQLGSITYEEKSAGDYMMNVSSRDSSIANLVFMQAVTAEKLQGENVCFGFDFKVTSLPIYYGGAYRNTRLLTASGDKDIMDIDFKTDGNLYAVTSKDAEGNEAPMIASGLEKNVWYSFSVTANTVTHTFGTRLARTDGTGAAQEKSGLTFRANGSYLKAFKFPTEKLQGTMYIDNVFFSKGKDTTSYGLMLLRSKSSDIKVDNAFLSSNPKIYGVSANSTVGELLSALTCDTKDAVISITDKDGGELSETEKIQGFEKVTVSHEKIAESRVYTVETPVQPINFYSLEVAGRQYAGSGSILLPGEATVWAAVTNSAASEATYYVRGTVGSCAPPAQKITVPANSTKRVKLTGKYIVPDLTTDGVFSLKLYSDEACQTLAGENSIAIATSTVTSMPNIFGSNMVLQRGGEVNIYGLAPTGTAVTAKLGSGSAVSGTAENGEFLVKLPAMQANNVGQTLTVRAGDKTFSFENVLVGDVIYGSGQSNMVQYYNGGYNEGQLAENASAREWLESRANWDNVRYYQAKINVDPAASVSVSEEPWWKVGKTDDKENGVMSYANMSSVLYSVADALRGLQIEKLDSDVPIAVVRCAVGGSKLSSWVDTDFIEANKDIAPNYYEYFENAAEFSENGQKYGVTDVYYAMVRSLIPFTFKAAIWYQGESDTDLYKENGASKMPYTDAANNMIAMMREKMGYELPYFIVQLPGYGQRDWSDIRLQQWEMYNPENKVYVAVTNDSGEKFGEYTGTENGVHPQDKRVVGDRLARLMAKYLYDETDIPYEAPNYKAADVSADGSVKVTFNAVNDGLHGKLVSRGSDSELAGFALSEDGLNWTAAAATITADGLGINVMADGITKPKYVSYAGIETAKNAPFTYSYPIKGAATAYDTDNDGVADAWLPVAPFKEEVSYIRTDDSFTETEYSCKMTFGKAVEKGGAKAIIAFYDNGGLVKTAAADITVSKGVQTVKIPVEKPASYDRYEVFVWSNSAQLKPLVKLI